MQFILSNARQPELLLKTSGADVKPSKKKLKKKQGGGGGGHLPTPLEHPRVKFKMSSCETVYLSFSSTDPFTVARACWVIRTRWWKNQKFAN